MKKTFYVCKYTTDSRQIIEKTFNSLSRAKKYVREKILVNIKPGGFFNMLRGLKNYDGDKVAEVLEKYLSDPNYEIHDFYSKYPLPDQDDEDDEDNEGLLYKWCVKEDGFRCEYNTCGEKFISIVCKNPNKDDDDLETMYSGHFPTDKNDYREDECWDDGWVGLVYKGREFYFVLDCGDIISKRFLDDDSLIHVELVIDKVELWDEKCYPMMIIGLIKNEPLSIKEIQLGLKDKYNVSVDSQTIKSYIMSFSEFGIEIKESKGKYSFNVSQEQARLSSNFPNNPSEISINKSKENNEDLDDKSKSKYNDDLFIFKDKKETYKAYLRYCDNEEYVLQKGSKVSETISKESLGRSYNKVVELRNQAGINQNNLILDKDMTFGSSSSAAYFVCGHSVAGTDVWKKGKKTLMDEKIDRSKKLLRDTDMEIDEIRTKLKFKKLSDFEKSFKKSVGKSPEEYRRNK